MVAVRGLEGATRVKVIGLLAVWLALVLGAPAGRAATPSIAGDAEAALAQIKSQLREVGAGVTARDLADREIQTRLASIPPIQGQLGTILRSLNPRLQDMQARQAQLGPPPPQGAPPEDPRTAQMRRDLNRAVTTLTADVQEARLLSLTANQISSTLSDRLRENFAARLWTRTRSILEPALWGDFAQAAPNDLLRLSRAVADEVEKAAPARRMVRSLFLGALGLAVGAGLLGPGRTLLNRIGYRRASHSEGRPRLRRILLASWLVFVAASTPLLAGLVLRSVLEQIDVMTPEMDRVTLLVIRVGVFAALLEGLGRALLSPGRPEWRLAPAPEGTVRRLAPFPGLIGAAAALSAFVSQFNTILGASLATRVAIDCVALLFELAVVIGALSAVGRARVAQVSVEDASAVDSESRLPWVLATLAAWAASITALAAVLVGYLALATFIMRELIWVGAILGLLSLLLRLADEAFPALLARERSAGLTVERALGLSQGSMDQIAVLLSGVTRLALFLLAWVAVLAPFGAGLGDIYHRFTSTDFVVRLGLVSISPGAILGGVAIFLAGLAITRAVRRWFEVRFLPKTAMDVGLRTSLATGVTYLGAVLALLVAFAYLGLTLAQIALFASALSVGIGFGLQSIISNFVSGLILLAERPVRVGDWVAIGDLEGDVRKISIRATEIEMFDRSRLILPNSELISKAVRNVTHPDALGRVRLQLKVEASADPSRVREILQGRLEAHPLVLRNPAPGVYLTDVRDGVMEFSAIGFVDAPRRAFAVKSELLFQIVPDLQAAGIPLASGGPTVRIDLDSGSPRPD